MGALRDEIEAYLDEFRVPRASWAVIDAGRLAETGTVGV